MRLDHVELRRIRLALPAPFRTSSGALTDREVLLVHVVGPDTEGWGECAALSEPTYSSEYVDGAAHVIRHHLLPRLMRLAQPSAELVAPTLAPLKGHRMAKSALEMAILDAELRLRGVSLASHLGAVHDRVAVGVSVGIAASISELLETVGRFLDDGYVRIKLKIAPGWDIEPVRAVRERFGDDVWLQVDANAAYTLADTERLRRLDPFHLLLIEQPLAEDDIAGHAALARQIRTPVCLDESITSARAAVDAIDRGACTVVNIKPGRVGGYLEARRVHDVCAARGVPVWCGGMFETGLGRAANLALAALPNFTLPGDISESRRYWARDLTASLVLEAGRLRVPDGPGLGVSPDPDVLAEVTVAMDQLDWER